MAVDQATAYPDLFKYLLNGGANNPVQIGNNLPYCGNGVGVAPVNEFSNVMPFYGINDVVFQSGNGKYSPAVKDDSGVTFNNSFVPPVTQSRKRQRESVVLPTAPMMSGGALAVNPIAVNKETNSFSFLGEDITLQIMHQEMEIDRLISQHISKMKSDVEDRKKYQLRRIMAVIEDSVTKRIREKDEQINKFIKINFELEERLKSLCIENQLWRDLAQNNEATANTLRSNLEQVLHQMRENAAVGDTTDDAVSCCGSNGGDADDTEIADVNQDGKKWVYRGEKNRRLCRNCGEGESSVLLLPCRHLCLCTSCGPAVNTCPICNEVKNASVHVNLS